ncbi:glycosyltransferase family 2 protein [Aliagarivorans marinus]|uniref:glycosyltransferase family 2 protein n=1 Tax=Aliagarivorans marinus TaxID=561965 RepID=UPI00041FDED7|nr:glycosyltransferase family 2 protein [Aliagarivorans marinus]
MTQQPLVSIITPAFKAQHSIADTVRSVMAQRYRHWEMLIVSDDHYDYRSQLKAQGLWDKRISLHYSEQRQSGPNAARNIALNAAQGELIAPLDADDSYYPERLSSLSPLAIEYGMAADNADIVSTEPQFGQQLGSALVSFDGSRLWSARAYCETNTR